MSKFSWGTFIYVIFDFGNQTLTSLNNVGTMLQVFSCFSKSWPSVCMKWSFVPKCAAQLPKPPTWEFILKHESHESCRLTTKSKHIWRIRSSASLKYWQMNSWNWSAFEIKASSFSSWVDPAVLRRGRLLREEEDEHTDLPVIISDTACVCESEAGVVWPGKKSCRARVRPTVCGRWRRGNLSCRWTMCSYRVMLNSSLGWNWGWPHY